MIKLIDQYLAESTDILPIKRGVIVFGRFNPPTIGHGKLIEKVLEVAGEDDHFIFPSPTVDKPSKKLGRVDPEKSKNPLPWEPKIGIMRELFPDANVMQDPEITSLFHAMGYMRDNGYTDVTLVVGSDRVESFQARLEGPMNESFETFKIVSAGVRDPDGEGTVGMSATKARIAAREDDLGGFRAATGWKGIIAEQLMRAVRGSMGLMEHAGKHQ